ncbi:MAG: PTS ascorbate transporter subunit IIC, partial [Enterococcus sp.]
VMFGLADLGGWYGNLDVSTVWLAFGALMKQFSVVGIGLVVIFMLVIPQLQYTRNKEGYF